MPSFLLRYIWVIGFLAAGGAASYFLYPIEMARVEEHLIGYPDSDKFTNQIRPILLVILCFLPALGSLLYQRAGLMDRYLTSELWKAFGICFLAFFSLLLLLEFQNHGSDFKDVDKTEVITFYIIQLPSMLMMILPYSLMLALLWCLGKLSKSQEIVSMIQSGRSVLRIMMPLVISGLFLTLTTLIFSYHWAPFAEGYKRTMLRELKGEPETAARDVGYQDPALRRMWTVGRFPRKFTTGEPLEKVTLKQVNKKGRVEYYLECEKALWKKQTASWEFHDVSLWSYLDDQGNSIGHPPYVFIKKLQSKYEETPWQIIRPGLEPTHLGIPELGSWIANHPQHPLSNIRKYQTWWHFRWAHPVLCVIIVLLAAPLGISFTRRTSGGGIAVAIFLSAGMLFCSTVFPTLGESGYLSPALAAWGTNILFASVAFVLFYRRATGQPVHQVIRRFLPFR